MDKQPHNPLTLVDLKAALTGFATKEELNALATQEALRALTTNVTTIQETVDAIMETVAETKEGMAALTGLMQDMLGGQTAIHEDVRYLRRSTDMPARSDAAHEAAIASLRKRLERVQKKIGIAK